MSMKANDFGRRGGLCGAGLLAAALIAPCAATASTVYTIANNTPKLVPIASKLGAKNPNDLIDVTFWLKPRNKAELDGVTKELYNPNSRTYRHFLDRATFAARFMPTAEDAAKVSGFAAAHGLSVTMVDKFNLFVRMRGTVDAVQRALHVRINEYAAKTTRFWGNDADPKIADAAGEVVQAVGGIESTGFSHPLAQPAIFSPGKSGGAARPAMVPAGRKMATSSGFTSACFGGVQAHLYTTGGGDPTAVYKGNAYVDSSTSNFAGCGYTPPEIQAAYNLRALYKEGYDGKGQTIVIVDWCGSPSIVGDANAFSQAFGLPPLTTTGQAPNFSIVNYPTASTCASEDAEINIDVEWAHAIAPGATILLLVPPSPTFDDINAALIFAIDNGLGNVISNSYGAEEAFVPLSIIEVENTINEAAAALGISAIYSSGDSGDFTFDQGNPASVSVPADSPYATAVGGISLALTRTNGIAWQTGWGTNETLLVNAGAIYDPPINFGFAFGAGGGPSAVFAKPAFQHKVKGTQRQVPDIAWLADPFTGGVIALSEPGAASPVYTVYGGTSLAAPMFAALWAIANQEAGQTLGEAAAYVYAMPASTITDITPYNAKTNVAATIVESPSTVHRYTAADIAAPLANTTRYLSATWDPPLAADTLLTLTFGTDSGLNTGKGWDPVTGVGVPNGKEFADWFAPTPK